MQDSVPPEIAVIAAENLGLEPIGVQYFGVMPRMVLLALEAWPRRDYARYLAKHQRAAAARFQKLRPPR
jgi:hypothetical protein